MGKQWMEGGGAGSKINMAVIDRNALLGWWQFCNSG